MTGRISILKRFVFLPYIAIFFAIIGYFIINITPQFEVAGASIGVNTTVDEFGENASACSIREAIQAINTLSAFGGCAAGTGTDDIIELPAGTYTITRVGRDENSNATGDFDLTRRVKIVGEDMDTTIIKGNADGAAGATSDRIFDMRTTNQTLHIDNVTLRDGHYEDGSGTVYGSVMFLADNTDLIMNKVTVTDNVAYAVDVYGGVIYFDGDSSGMISNSTFTNNIITAPIVYGGVFYLNNVSVMRMYNTTFSDNVINIDTTICCSGDLDGGIIHSYGDWVRFYNMTFSDNTTNIISDSSTDIRGGVMYFYLNREVWMFDSTLENNLVTGTIDGFADLRGSAGIYSYEVIEIESSTFTDNAVDVDLIDDSTDSHFLYGAALYTSGGGFVKNSTFTSNSIDYTVNALDLDEYIYALGSAIYTIGNALDVSFSTFTNNTADTTSTMIGFGHDTWERHQVRGKYGGALGSHGSGFRLKANVFKNDADTTTNCWANREMDLLYQYTSENFNVDDDGTCTGTASETNDSEVWLDISTGSPTRNILDGPPRNIRSFNTGDFNNDGDIDLVSHHDDSTDIKAWINNGSGAFSLVTLTGSGGIDPDSLVVGDFNNDTYDDVLIQSRNTINIWEYNSGTGNFDSPVSPFDTPSNSYRTNVVTGDFDNDGMDDFAYTERINSSSSSLHIQYQNGGGGFQTRTLPIATPSGFGYRLAVGDINGDTIDDIIIGDRYVYIAEVAPRMMGGYAVGTSLNEEIYEIEVGDFNNDGNDDWVVLESPTSSYAATRVYYYDVGTTTAYRYDITPEPISGASDWGRYKDVVVADFNGDNNDDIAYAQAFAENEMIYISDGDAGFGGIGGFTETDLGNGGETYAVDAGDLDGDTDIDLVFGNHLDEDNEIWLNNGSGVFTQQVLTGSGMEVVDVIIEDFDGDTTLDVLFGAPARPWARYPQGADLQTDPSIGSLGDYGGTTETHSLNLSSPVIDHADNCLDAAGTDIARDQRGFSRSIPYDGDHDGTANCDPGAYELLITDLAITIDAPSNEFSPGDLIQYTIEVDNIGADYAYDSVLTNTIPEGTSYVGSSLTVDEPLPLLYTAPVWYEDEHIHILDLEDFASPVNKVVQSTRLMSDMGVFYGIHGLDRHPTTGVVYTIARISWYGDQLFGTIDLETGEFTYIAAIEDEQIASIAFDNSGTLFALSGEDSDHTETLFTIDEITGVLTEFDLGGGSGHLGNGDDGEALVYNYDDGLLYHFSGLNDPNIIIETIDTDTGTITNIPFTNPTALDGYSFQEIEYIGNNQFITNSWGDLFTLEIVDDAGTTKIDAVDVGLTIPHTSRGMVPVNGRNPTCSHSSGEVICPLGILSDDASAEVTVTVRVDALTGDQLGFTENTFNSTQSLGISASVTSSSLVQDTNLSNNTTNDTVTVQASVGATEICGNGLLEASNGEQCDDGNVINGDGCSSTCTIEIPGSGGSENSEDEESTEEEDQGEDTGDGQPVLDETPETGGDVPDTQDETEDSSSRRSLLALFLISISNILLAMAGGGLISSALGLNIRSALPYAIWKRHKKPWGRIFDTRTHKPIPFAVVRLFKEGEIIQSVVSDMEGRYSFSVEFGEYKLEVKHSDYESFDKMITIQGQIVVEDIPLKALNSKQLIYRLNSEHGIKKTLRIVNIGVFLAGLIIAVATLFEYPNIYIWIVNFIYFVFGALYVYRYFNERKLHGKVLDIYNDPLPGTGVRLLAETEVIDILSTNADGLFNYAIHKGKFDSIYLSKPGHAFPASTKKSQYDLKDMGLLKDIITYTKNQLSKGKLKLFGSKLLDADDSQFGAS